MIAGRELCSGDAAAVAATQRQWRVALGTAGPPKPCVPAIAACILRRPSRAQPATRAAGRLAAAGRSCPSGAASCGLIRVPGTDQAKTSGLGNLRAVPRCARYAALVQLLRQGMLVTGAAWAVLTSHC